MAFVGRFSAYIDLLRFRIGCGGPYVKSVFVVSDCPVELLAIKRPSRLTIQFAKNISLLKQKFSHNLLAPDQHNKDR